MNIGRCVVKKEITGEKHNFIEISIAGRKSDHCMQWQAC